MSCKTGDRCTGKGVRQGHLEETHTDVLDARAVKPARGNHGLTESQGFQGAAMALVGGVVLTAAFPA